MHLYTREKIIRSLLGQQVHVIVDRPIGYRHKGMVYPVNYGYIPGVLAADAEEQDVYVLGVDQPVSSFDGRVIAVIRRRNDQEDKLVAAPEGIRLHQGQIGEAVAFQEQYFDTEIQSLFQKSCGVIPFRNTGDKAEFLILLQNNGGWSFPKGHMEAGETETETALRELYEETGLRAILIPELSVTMEYDIPPLTRKQVVLFPGRVSGDITLQAKEIAGCRWVSKTELQAHLHPHSWHDCRDLLEQIEKSLSIASAIT